MKTLHCIDQLHAQGVNNYIRAEGHESVLHGRSVITGCDNEQVIETAAGFGLALVEPATPEDVDVFNSF